MKKVYLEKGITLIALVVTTVSISMLTGENGIILQTNKAKVQTDHHNL